MQTTRIFRMGRLSGKDYVMICILLLVLGVLTFGPGKGMGKKVPTDPRHMPIYEAIRSGRPQAETELVCSTCHGKSSVPLPKNHPPKEQCLTCHQLI
jgi:hypothetical protein